MIKFIKKPTSIIILVLLIIGFAIAIYFHFNQEKKSNLDITAVKRATIYQIVSVTGRVKPAEKVDLAFEKGGKVSAIYADVGKQVSEGEILVTLENAELIALLNQAKANLEAEQAKLNELEKGTREEEIQTYKTKVTNAERSLLDAQKNLETMKEKSIALLNDVYSSAISSAQDAINVGKNALLTLTDIQFSHFLTSSQESVRIANAKAVAVKCLLGADNAGYWTNKFIALSEGGAYKAVKNAIENPSFENIDQALNETIFALQKVKEALDVVPITDAFTSTEKTNLITEKNNVNSKITIISGKQTAISVQKTTNEVNIKSAESAVVSAQNTLDSAKSELELKKAGNVSEEIIAQKARVESAKATVENYKAQIVKTILRAPISGMVIKQDAKVGEVISSGVSIISLFSNSEFEIETNIPEADIAKVKIGDSAKITLDAYGDNLTFEARVVKIDPAETMIEGVATYKTTLQFIKKYEGIKSGMTANVDILTDKRENVIVIPQRAVITKDEKKFVQILENGKEKEIEVEVGIKDSNGNIEVISGLNEGDKVVISSK